MLWDRNWKTEQENFRQERLNQISSSVSNAGKKAQAASQWLVYTSPSSGSPLSCCPTLLSHQSKATDLLGTWRCNRQRKGESRREQRMFPFISEILFVDEGTCRVYGCQGTGCGSCCEHQQHADSGIFLVALRLPLPVFPPLLLHWSSTEQARAVLTARQTSPASSLQHYSLVPDNHGSANLTSTTAALRPTHRQHSDNIPQFW